MTKLRRDSQVLSWVLSYDGVRKPDALAITAAGAALALSEIPLVKPVAGVQVGWPEGSPTPVVNPTIEQMETRYVLVGVVVGVVVRGALPRSLAPSTSSVSL
jgi:polyribonucleotide nucleotidyltransferase